MSAEELRYLYRRARVALVPSRYEGFGVPALEALTYGVPLIVSDIPVLLEVTGGAAVSVPLDRPDLMAAEMVRLNRDVQLRHSFIQKGKQRAEAYTWQQSARRTLQGLLRVAQGKAATAVSQPAELPS